MMSGVSSGSMQDAVGEFGVTWASGCDKEGVEW